MNNHAERKSDTALYVAGNSNIFFPALVALTSIEKHNPGQFDRFMCFEKAQLTPEMSTLLEFYGIQFVDTGSLDILDKVRDMAKMPGWWPLEVYLNWGMPEYFADQGYKYSIKSDYDVLCIAPYETDFTHYLAENQPFTGITTGAQTTENITKETWDTVRSQLSLSCEHKKAINVGFLFCDNHVCKEVGLFDRFKELHSIIARQEPRIFVDEQLAASILMHQMPKSEAKYLHERYNMRVRRSPNTAEDLRADIANIHYITAFKPWKPLTPKDAQSCGKTYHPIVPMYRNLWIRYAETLKKSELYLTEKPLDELQLIGAIANGTKGVTGSVKKINQERDRAGKDLVKAKKDLAKTKKDLAKAKKDLEIAKRSWLGTIKAKIKKLV